MTRRTLMLIWLALAIGVGLPLLNTAAQLLWSKPQWVYLTTLGGRIEPEDDLLPASDPAFAAALHAGYHFDIDQGSRPPAAFYLRFATEPPLPHPSADTLRTLACRVGALLAKPHWLLAPNDLLIEDQMEAGRPRPPVTVKVADCRT